MEKEEGNGEREIGCLPLDKRNDDRPKLTGRRMALIERRPFEMHVSNLSQILREYPVCECQREKAVMSDRKASGCLFDLAPLTKWVKMPPGNVASW